MGQPTTGTQSPLARDYKHDNVTTRWHLHTISFLRESYFLHLLSQHKGSAKFIEVSRFNKETTFAPPSMKLK